MIQSNNASSRISSQLPGDSASAGPRPFFPSASAVCASTSESVSSVASGTFTLPAFVAKSMPVLAITILGYTCHVAPTPSNFISPALLAVFQSVEYSFASLKLEKAFIVGPGHAPISSKLVSKIIGGQVVELADLLSANLRPVEQEP